jgi:hypothetical protein
MAQTIDALKRPGWLTFAAVVLFAVAGLRLISGISYLADSGRVSDLSAGLFGGNVFWWGIWDLVIAGLAFFAAYSLLGGNPFGRIVAYVWAILVIIESFLILGWAPWFGAAAIALALLVIYAVSVTSDYREETLPA